MSCSRVGIIFTAFSEKPKRALILVITGSRADASFTDLAREDNRVSGNTLADALASYKMTVAQCSTSSHTIYAEVLVGDPRVP